MNNILAQIYKSSETTNTTVVSIDATMKKLLQLETLEYKKEEKDRKDKARNRRREAQLAKRKAGDKKGLFGALSKKEQKKEKNTMMDLLKGVLGTIGGGIMSILGGLGTLVGGALTAAIGGLGLGGLLSGALATLGPALIVALKAAAIAAAAGALAKTGSTVAGGIYRQTGGTAKSKGGVGFDLQDIKQLKDEFRQFNTVGRGVSTMSGSVLEQYQKYEQLEESMRSSKAANDRLYQINQEIEELKLKEGNWDEKIAELEKQAEQQQEAKEEHQRKNTELLEQLQISDRDLIQHQIDQGRRDINNLPQGYDKSKFKDRPWGTGTKSQWEFHTYGDESGSTKTPEFTLPVQRQTGGLIPTLLEPGEKVFMPGQWDASIKALNDTIPRFQTGGQVGDTTRSKNAPEGEDAQPAEGGGSGVQAVLRAAEANIGLSAGQNMQCANTTRAVLRQAGHPAADKLTQTGDLDPAGMQWVGPGTAAGFAGTDMGSVTQDMNATKAGDIILWKNTFSSMGGDVPGAITHVGIKGEGNTVYHHNIGPGWRKTGFGTRGGYDRKHFAYGIDLNGEATGVSGTRQGGQGGAGGAGGGVGGGLESNALLKSLGGIGGFAVGLVQGFAEEFGGLAKMAVGNMGVAGGAMSGLGGAALGLGQGLFDSFMGGSAQAAEQPGQPGAVSPGGDASAGAASINDPNAKALLNAIAEAEGTANKPNNGYNTHYAGDQTADLSQHPAIIKRARYSSDAFGRYQFMSPTWAGLGGAVAAHDGKPAKSGFDMSPENQDKAALKLVAGRGVNISDGLSRAEITKLGGEWASIKGGGYGQAYHDADSFMKIYKKYGGAEQRQTGGTVGASPRGIGNLSGGEGAGFARLAEAQASYNEVMMQVANQDPIIVFEDEPVPTAAGEPSPNQDPPTLPDGPSTVQAAEYFYNLNFGGSF